jgi:hypothetical protein
MLKLFLFSLRKSKILSKVASASNKKHLNANELLGQTIKNMNQGRTLSKRELYIEQLLTLLASDRHTTDLLSAFGRTFDDIRKIISKLEVNGAGQIVKGHYVAVSSVAFLRQLRFILEHWDGENFMIDNLNTPNSNIKMAYNLIQSFE